jgi:pyruvate formate-lyase activating enzyme-like uncharacterized protein
MKYKNPCKQALALFVAISFGGPWAAENLTVDEQDRAFYTNRNAVIPEITANLAAAGLDTTQINLELLKDALDIIYNPEFLQNSAAFPVTMAGEDTQLIQKLAQFARAKTPAFMNGNPTARRNYTDVIGYGLSEALDGAKHDAITAVLNALRGLPQRSPL